MAKPLELPIFQAFTKTGTLAKLAGGKVYTYQAGTLTDKSTYTDSGLGTPNANPTILGSDGTAEMWPETGAYRVIIHDANDVELYDIDDISFATETLADVAANSTTTADQTFAMDSSQDFIIEDSSGNDVITAKESSGYVGIAEEDPRCRLHVRDANNGITILPSGTVALLETTSDCYITLSTTSGNATGVYLNGTGTKVDWDGNTSLMTIISGGAIDLSAATNMDVDADGGALNLRATSGKVTIQTNTVSQDVDIVSAGGIDIDSAGTIDINAGIGSQQIFITGSIITVDGQLVTDSPSTSAAGFRMPNGTAPTSPVSGDFWYDGTSLFFRDGSTTRTLTWT